MPTPELDFIASFDFPRRSSLSPSAAPVSSMAEETGKQILSRLDDIDRQLSLLLTSGVRLDGELLRMGNTNEATARVLMGRFDRLIGGKSHG